MKTIDDHKKRYAVNFDFSMDKLKEQYPNSNITQAYDDIKRFLTSHGFQHRQGSGYMSFIELSATEFNKTIRQKYRKQKDKQMNEITPIQEIEAKDNTDELFTLLQDVVSKGLDMKTQMQQKVREIEDEIEI